MKISALSVALPSEGQGRQACCSAWDHKESDMTEQLTSNKLCRWFIGKINPSVQETQETLVQSLGWEDPLKEEMTTHSSILA